MYIKGCIKFMFNKAKSKNRKYFCKCCLQCFNSERILVEHREICLKINGKQSVKLKSGLLNSKMLEAMKEQVVVRQKNIKITCSFAYQLVFVDNKFSNPDVLYRGENAAYNFIKMMLEEFGYCKKVMKNHFNKSLIMSEKEENFQSSNTCWKCEKLIDDE